ncbi:MAG: diguanylate cyclase [Deltaproteobacteria bacterium]|nr:diguanylate cyclase [Deltaproteobacteria bacterium]
MSTIRAPKNVFSNIGLMSYSTLLFIVAGTGWFATGYLGAKAGQEIREDSESTITLLRAHFTAEFDKAERAVQALSGSPWILPALVSRKDPDIANANSVLDRYNSSLNASATYLMDGNGLTIASSNRNDPDSFVGKTFQFRPYFTQAISGVPGRYFALGTTSLKRGFYASSAVRDTDGRIVGVAVIKRNIDEDEVALGGYPYFFLVDPNGIIFLSGSKELNFRSLWPISRETRLALLQSKQFGEKGFDAILPLEVSDGMDIPFNGKNYLVSRKVIDPDGWSIVFMAPTERILIYKSVGVVVTLWMCTVIAVPFIINYRAARSAEKVRNSEARFRELFNTMKSGVAIYRPADNGQDFIITDINPAGERISQVTKQDIVGRSITAAFPGVREHGLFDVMKQVWRTGVHQYHPVSLYSDNRLSLWVENTVYRLASGEIVAIYDDVSDRKRMEAEILTLSITDPLTGLHNRRGFLSLAEQQLKLSERNRRRMLLFFADLDGLKWINDMLGHEEGDRALIEAATVFKATFRTSDIMARLGGDEFAVLAIDTDEIQSEIFTARLQHLIDTQNNLKDHKYKLSISVGCACYDPEKPCSINELMAQADKLMYVHKQGRKLFSF